MLQVDSVIAMACALNLTELQQRLLQAGDRRAAKVALSLWTRTAAMLRSAGVWMQCRRLPPAGSLAAVASIKSCRGYDLRGAQRKRTPYCTRVLYTAYTDCVKAKTVQLQLRYS